MRRRDDAWGTPKNGLGLHRKTAGEPLEVLRWQSRFIKGAFASDVETAALSVARGNGKTNQVKDRMYISDRDCFEGHNWL